MRIGTTLTIVALACALASGPAWTQDEEQQPGAPLRLVAPPPTPDRESTPDTATPAGIDTTTLGPLDPSWADALPKGETPLPRDMWEGTSRPILGALLTQLGPTDSPALRSLARRVLLSGAAAPGGTDPAGGPSLVVLRAEALARIGDVTGGKAVLDNVSDKKGEAADRLRIELAIAGGDIADACQRVATGLTAYQNAWWDQANIACQFLSGARDKAALALDILHDRGGAPDPLFDTLVAAASGHAAPRLDKHTVLTPLQAALWGVSKRPLPAEVIASMDAATAAAFADSAAPASSRLPAAEHAASLGAWPPDRLAALYDKLDVSDAERATVLGDEKPGETAINRAALFAIAHKDGDAAQRAKALALFLAAARRHDLYFVAVQMAAPVIVALGPGDATKDAAPEFVRALVAAGRAGDAAAWLGLVSPADPLMTVARALDGVRPDDKAAGEALAALSLRAKDSAGAIGLYLTLISDFGAPPTGAELAAQMAHPHQAVLPSAAVWLDLRRATSGHRLGETILASLVVAQDGARLTTEPLLIQRVIAALRGANLDADARAIAREAAVAADL